MGHFKRMVCNTIPTPARPPIYQRFRACEWKKRYTDEATAARAVKRIKENGVDTKPDRVLRHYKCDVCFGWHVGHTHQPVQFSNHHQRNIAADISAA